jgi:hypothetical protein
MTLNIKFSVVTTNELVEFDKQPVEIQDSRKITDHFIGIQGIHLEIVTKNQKITTCNRLDLEALGSRLMMPKIFPEPMSKENRWLITDEPVEFEK